MRKNVLLAFGFILVLCLLEIVVYGQITCGFDVLNEEQLRNDPLFKSKQEAFEKIWQEKQELMNNAAARVVVTGADTVYEIPVVFHIIHTGSAIGTQFNPTDAKIQGVVDYLNQTYAATWPGYATTATGGVNIPLRFVLAKRDSLCNPTTGINRINGVTALGGSTGNTYNTYGVEVSSNNGITDAQLKSIIQWNPANYYNIWVVNKMDGWSGYVSGSGPVGYAFFPGTAPSLDGTVIMDAFNDAGQSILPHELGHAFNLYHTFQAGCVAASGCATNGDMVCDTDPHDQLFGCPSGNNPCTGTTWAPVKNNIMNYTDCTDRFTAGQAGRVKATLLYLRGSLIQSLGGTIPGSGPSYTLPVALSGCTTPGISNPNNNFDIGPNNIAIADLQSYSGGYSADGYKVYVNRTVSTCSQPAIAPAHMTVGQSYTVAVGTGYNPENVRVYIDLNNNGTFNTATETVFASNGIVGDNFRVHTGNTIPIPVAGTVTNTPLRMRVVSDYYGNVNPAACGSNLMYGQSEDFTVIIANVPLAVDLSYIEAKATTDNSSIELLWKVGEEVNMDHYDIERSADGKAFKKIDDQHVKGSNSVYSFNDTNPMQDKLNFYRLKIVHKDQSFSYSKIVSARINSNSTLNIQLYPNPTPDILNIITPATGTFDLDIKNKLGQVIYTRQGIAAKREAPVQVELKGSVFAPGVYYLQMIGKSGWHYYGKFVKQ